MSTANIVSIDPVGLGAVGVLVTFRCNHGKDQLTYFYSSLEAAKAILSGDDPSNWQGVRVDGEGGAISGAGESIGSEIAGDIADIGAL
jgi:hypothetical protein